MTAATLPVAAILVNPGGPLFHRLSPRLRGGHRRPARRPPVAAGFDPSKATTIS